MLKVMPLCRCAVGMPAQVCLILNRRLRTTTPSSFLPCLPFMPPPRNMFEKKEHQCLHPKSSRLHTDSLGRSTISEHVANVPRIKERQRQRHNPCGGRDRPSTGSGRPPGCTTIFPGLFVVPMPTATPAEMASVIRMTMNQNIFKMEIIF